MILQKIPLHDFSFPMIIFYKRYFPKIIFHVYSQKISFQVNSYSDWYDINTVFDLQRPATLLNSKWLEPALDARWSVVRSL